MEGETTESRWQWQPRNCGGTKIVDMRCEIFGVRTEVYPLHTDKSYEVYLFSDLHPNTRPMRMTSPLTHLCKRSVTPTRRFDSK